MIAAARNIASSPDLLVWVRRVAVIGLSALAAWLLVRTGLAFFAPESRWTPVLISAPPATQTASAGAVYDFSDNPFAAGDLVTDTGPAETAVDPGDDAPETTLNLTLKGLRSGENGAAFIQTPDGREDNVYIGEEILPNVFLRAVFPDYVLIDVNGQTQRLTTEDAKAARQQSASSEPQRSAASTIRPVDAQSFMSQVRMTPYTDPESAQRGVRVEPRSAGVDLAPYGLRSGDVITRIGGLSLSDGPPDLSALRRLAQSGRPLTVELVRDGQTQSITIGAPS